MCALFVPTATSGRRVSNGIVNPVVDVVDEGDEQRVRALFDFVPIEPGDLEFKAGDILVVFER